MGWVILLNSLTCVYLFSLSSLHQKKFCKNTFDLLIFLIQTTGNRANRKSGLILFNAVF